MPKGLKFVVEQWVLLWYDGKGGRRGNSKFSNRPVNFESNRDVRFEFESSQVPTADLQFKWTECHFIEFNANCT